MTHQKPIAVFLSDFHMGEVYGGVSRTPAANQIEKYTQLTQGSCYVRNEYFDFLNHLEKLYNAKSKEKIKYLILLGDIWDLAMHDASDVFNLSKEFFNKISEFKGGYSFSDFFEQIIYIPGNHDHHVWRMFQEQNSLVDNLLSDKEVEELPQQIIGTLDLTEVNPRLKIESSYGDKDGNNFISYSLGNARIKVHVVYPNLYIKYGHEDNEGIMVTHGHFFEPTWNMVSDNFQDLIISEKIDMDIANIEMFNSPTNEFYNYSLAQMNNRYNFWEQLYDGSINNIKPVFWNVFKDKLGRLFPNFFNNGSGEKPDKEHDIHNLNKYHILVDHYLGKSMSEMNDHIGINFDKLVYGHTHIPCFHEEYKFRDEKDKETKLHIYNTGGWVNINYEHFKSPNPMVLLKNGDIKRVIE